MITLSIILTVVFVASFFIIRNLLKQIEKSEDIQTKYENFIEKQSEAINTCNQRLKEIDDKGMFYADDQIGFFFKEVQKIQDALNEFTLR
jgi:predicted PurR-regulated permease PerM